jgi:hypothetical protein
MALTGELTDLSLAELIEFFCNQRKTGRLKVVYPTGAGYFYLQSGSVVHARVGDLRGIEAVYFALTQRNASFTFSPAFEAPEHSINQPWTSVVLEGLRRMDEGIHPPNPFSEGVDSSVEEGESSPIEEIKPQPVQSKPKVVEPVVHHAEKPPEVPSVRLEKPPQPSKTPAKAVPFLSQVEPSSRFATKPWKLGVVFAAIVLIIGVVAVPWGWYARSKAARLANEPKPVLTEPVASNSEVAPSDSPANQPETEAAAPAANSEATDLARRQREARLREEARAREKAAEATALPGQQPSSSVATQAAAKPQISPSAGAKKVTVQVTYDENGRVTQASGGDATALRIARQKRFPAGKSGSATITIPIN